MHFNLSQTRLDWEHKAKSQGFCFYKNYWDETHYYSFTETEMLNVIHPAIQELHDLCIDAVGDILKSEELISKFDIPEWFQPYLLESWQRSDASLIGRFDLVYDGQNSPKMLEYNGDTPSMLYETGYFQREWLKDMIDSGNINQNAAQYSNLQDDIVNFFCNIYPYKQIHFSCLKNSDEDFCNMEYVLNCAKIAGVDCRVTFIEDINISNDFQLLDQDNEYIQSLFKYYPWEIMVTEENGINIPKMKTSFLEPAWKYILTSKAILPILWQKYKGHPNLLPSYFEDDKDKYELSSNYVVKPIYSREGSNVTIFKDGIISSEVKGPYAHHKKIYQRFCDIPCFNGRWTVLGGWVINHRASALSIRETTSEITDNWSYFTPHIVL